MPRQPAASVRHHRHHVLQPVAAQAFYAQEPEQRTQRGRRQPHRPRPKTTRELTNKADHVSCADTGGIHPTIAEHCLQQSACEPDVVTPASPRTPPACGPDAHRRPQQLHRPSTDHDDYPSTAPILRTNRTQERQDYAQLPNLTSDTKETTNPVSHRHTTHPDHQPHITTGCT